MNKKIISIVVVIIVGIAAFFGGMQYQKSQVTTRSAQFANGARTGQTGNARFAGAASRNGQAVMGEILSMDDTSITVKMQDGSSKIVILSGTTSINKQASGTKQDLKAGEQVAVFGTNNSDGSVTAQSVQLNPMVRIQRPSGTPTPTK